MGRIRQTAHAQAKAEYAPQRHGVRREERSQARSLRSMEPAQLASIALARRQLRHSGLSPRDLAIAESELAHRSMDVGSGTALQLGQLHRSAQEQLVDLSAGQGQAESGIMAQLQQAAQQRQQEVADDKRSNVEDFKLDIAKAQALEKLGLSGDSGGGGLTPTQQRAHNQSRHDAAFYAKQYVSAAREGLKDEETGDEILPPGPHNWNDQQWNLFVEKVTDKAGVNVTDAQHAVQAVRDHFTPQSEDTGDAFRKLGAVAGAAFLPKSLRPIAQFLIGNQ